MRWNEIIIDEETTGNALSDSLRRQAKAKREEANKLAKRASIQKTRERMAKLNKTISAQTSALNKIPKH